MAKVIIVFEDVDSTHKPRIMHGKVLIRVPYSPQTAQTASSAMLRFSS